MVHRTRVASSPPARRRALGSVAVLGLAAGGLLLSSVTAANASTTAAKKAPTPTVVVAGLNNPRQITIGWDGRLYVAEAGSGGTDCVGTGQDETCVGLTGSISRVNRPWEASNTSPARIITGLPSGSGPDGSFAVGSDGVSVRGNSVFVQETFAPPDVLPSAPAFEFIGKLLEKSGSNPIKIRADISAAELKLDPDHKGFDSDPYAVLALSDRILVADAAANAVFQVRGDKVSVWAVFGDDKATGAQFVPTYLTLGPDGNVYVAGLGGEVPGAGKVVKLTQSGKRLHTWTGFTTVTGVGVGHDGTLYVSELFANQSDDPTAPPPGQLTVVRGGHRTSVPVPFPAGVALDPKGVVYVSAWSVAPEGGLGGGLPTSGQVWRFRGL